MENHFPSSDTPVDVDKAEDPGFHEHDYFAITIAESHYRSGNADVTRVHRVLLYCQRCGEHKFLTDHDAPDIPENK